MYTTHRIPGSPSSPAAQRPPAARRASESGGGSENRLEVACSRGTRRFQREQSVTNTSELSTLWFHGFEAMIQKGPIRIG